MAEEAGASIGNATNNEKILISKKAKMSENSSSEDRLSTLPKPLILHILSLLNSTKHAASTCVLSKKWQYLWTELSELDFEYYDLEIEKVQIFVDWITKTLSSIPNAIHLNKFKIDFCYNCCFEPSVDRWIEFLIENKVKDVAFHFSPVNNDHYDVPKIMYYNPYLTNLTLINCHIDPPYNMRWKCLTSLWIYDTILNENVIGMIVSGCPVLECLKLYYCCGFSILDLSNARSLKELVVYDLSVYDYDDDTSFLDIVAPYLEVISINYMIGTMGGTFRFIDISSLVRDYLYFSKHSIQSLGGVGGDEEDKMNYVKELIENFRGVEELEIGSELIEVISNLKREGWKISRMLCKRLILSTYTDAYDIIPGIICMLEASPKVETLVINWGCTPCDERHVPFDLKRDLLNLKNIKFTDFGGPYPADAPTSKLVQFLLKRAVVLEKMIIDVKVRVGTSTLNSDDYLKIAESVRGYPRSSPKAVIQVCY